MKTKQFNEYETPVCTQMQMETTGVLASSFTFGNYSLGIDDDNTTEYNPEWF